MNTEMSPKMDFVELIDEVLSIVKQFASFNVEIEFIGEQFGNNQTRLKDIRCQFKRLEIKANELFEEIHQETSNFYGNQQELDKVKKMYKKQVNQNSQLIKQLQNKGYKVQDYYLSVGGCNIQEHVLNTSIDEMQNNLKDGGYRPKQEVNQFFELQNDNEDQNISYDQLRIPYKESKKLNKKQLNSAQQIETKPVPITSYDIKAPDLQKWDQPKLQNFQSSQYPRTPDQISLEREIFEKINEINLVLANYDKINQNESLRIQLLQQHAELMKQLHQLTTMGTDNFQTSKGDSLNSTNGIQTNLKDAKYGHPYKDHESQNNLQGNDQSKPQTLQNLQYPDQVSILQNKIKELDFLIARNEIGYGNKSDRKFLYFQREELTKQLYSQTMGTDHSPNQKNASLIEPLIKKKESVPTNKEQFQIQRDRQQIQPPSERQKQLTTRLPYKEFKAQQKYKIKQSQVFNIKQPNLQKQDQPKLQTFQNFQQPQTPDSAIIQQKITILNQAIAHYDQRNGKNPASPARILLLQQREQLTKQLYEQTMGTDDFPTPKPNSLIQPLLKETKSIQTNQQQNQISNKRRLEIREAQGKKCLNQALWVVLSGTIILVLYVIWQISAD